MGSFMGNRIEFRISNPNFILQNRTVIKQTEISAAINLTILPDYKYIFRSEFETPEFLFSYIVVDYKLIQVIMMGIYWRKVFR